VFCNIPGLHLAARDRYVQHDHVCVSIFLDFILSLMVIPPAIVPLFHFSTPGICGLILFSSTYSASGSAAISSPAFVVVVIFIISWCIASVFMVVYETCIDTVCWRRSLLPLASVLHCPSRFSERVSAACVRIAAHRSSCAF
jgi:hypothetical protein